MSAPTFVGYPKTPRLFRDTVITEKIDGTNAAVGIGEDGSVHAQSRNRIITPGDDNFGFAAWVEANADTLRSDLGPGLHFGEWWGHKIGRGYGLTERRFSLFNANRWGGMAFVTPALHVVPILARHTFDSGHVERLVQLLRWDGSVAAPGFMQPEGVVVFHVAAQQVFKVLCEGDALPKGVAA